MNVEALVEVITKEVYNRLQNIPVAKKAEPLKTAVFVATEVYPQLEGILAHEYTIQYFDDSVMDCDVVVIPKMCIQLLGNLANGLSSSPRERFILTMLLKGKNVIALDDGLVYKKYKQTANAHLFKMYEEYQAKVESFGIKIIHDTQLLQSCCEKKVVHNVQVTNSQMNVETQLQTEAAVISKKVITEADLKKFHLRNVKEIIVTPNSIITPLAKDYIRMQQMHVQRA
ncbi:ethanolamine utilization protein [Bacillus sp. 491mf]|uniref:ethanolamine utilization protein n=1 Tax=Bacillus sp. 491mf TaxID=1761755 RepID=UPI0008F43396|nr:ethanolamine utilization protein [Bacillus sp. 491mf]SFC49016.1 ethanolamine utilization protein [Bacillus sp. 491mf]